MGSMDICYANEQVLEEIRHRLVSQLVFSIRDPPNHPPPPAHTELWLFVFSTFFRFTGSFHVGSLCSLTLSVFVSVQIVNDEETTRV